jgi:hypothetical protein
MPTPLEEARDPNTSAERLAALWAEDSPDLTRLRHAIAQHPKTPPRILQQILEHQLFEPALVASLGVNPGASLELLHQAWEREPESFLQNPLVPLLLLESPDLWRTLPDATLAGLLSLPSLRAEVLAFAAERRHRGVLTRLARHPNTSPKILSELLMNYDEEVYAAALQHPSLPQEKIEMYLGYENLSYRRAAAQNPSLDPLLRSLLKRIPELLDKDSRAKQPATCTHTELLALARCGEAMRKYVVTYPETPGVLLAAIALDSEDLLFQQITQRDPTLREEVRAIRYSITAALRLARLLAIHPNLPAELVAFYANHYSSALRAVIAGSSALTPSLQATLCQDPSPEVRVALAANPHLAPELTETLSLDTDRNVRATIAKHPKSTPEIRRRLALDKRPEVAMAVFRAAPDRELLALLSVCVHPRVRQLASAHLLGDQAQNQTALALEAGLLPPEEELRGLLSQGPYVLQLIAAHERCPRWFYEALAQGTSLNQRLVAARSERTPPEILQSLSTDDALLVRLSVAKNPATPEGVLLSMLSEEVSILRAMAQNQGLTERLHQALLHKNSEVVVLLLAQNPSTKPTQYEALLRAAKRRAKKQLRSLWGLS